MEYGWNGCDVGPIKTADLEHRAHYSGGVELNAEVIVSLDGANGWAEQTDGDHMTYPNANQLA